ncbi:MAG: hypothetical protein O2894_11440 [Planctomycetota bacterium]|nr:hypothetical protein [Planctomycetota bacterium]
MTTTLLTFKPPSGRLAEWSGCASARCNVWVRFEGPGDEAPWLGVFGAGDGFFCSVCALSARVVLVVSGGRGYVVDVAARSLLRTLDWSIMAAAEVPGTDCVVAADFTEVWLTYFDKDVRLSLDSRSRVFGDDPHRAALDGVVFDSVTQTTVDGAVWLPDGWYRFTVDVAQKTLSRGELVSTKWNAVLADGPLGGSPHTEEYATAMRRHLLP